MKKNDKTSGAVIEDMHHNLTHLEHEHGLKGYLVLEQLRDQLEVLEDLLHIEANAHGKIGFLYAELIASIIELQREPTAKNEQTAIDNAFNLHARDEKASQKLYERYAEQISDPKQQPWSHRLD